MAIVVVRSSVEALAERLVMGVLAVDSDGESVDPFFELALAALAARRAALEAETGAILGRRGRGVGWVGVA